MMDDSLMAICTGITQYNQVMEEMRAEQEIQYQQEDTEALTQYNEYWKEVHYEEETYWYYYNMSMEEIDWLENGHRIG